MTSTGSIYYDEIHRRANYDLWKQMLKNGDVTFEQWKAHWLATAYVWEAECRKEGLKETASYIWKIIELSR